MTQLVGGWAKCEENAKIIEDHPSSDLWFFETSNQSLLVYRYPRFIEFVIICRLYIYIIIPAIIGFPYGLDIYNVGPPQL